LEVFDLRRAASNSRFSQALHLVSNLGFFELAIFAATFELAYRNKSHQ
jgi:hypothetical protein